MAVEAQAMESFRTAIHVAREQRALFWELRAGVSLVRLLRAKGEATELELAEAEASLRKAYDTFTEGFTLPDLQDAAELLTTATAPALAG